MKEKVEKLGIFKKLLASIMITGMVGSYVPYIPTKAAGIAPTSLSINKSSAVVFIPTGVEFLEVIATPNNADGSVTWTSSDTGIVTVNSNGELIAGTIAGNATVTATSKLDSKVKVTCAVETGAAGNNQTRIIAQPSSATVLVGEKKLLQSSVEPSGVTYTVADWTSGNPSVATVSRGGLVKAISPGSAVLTVTGIPGLTSTTTITVPSASISINKSSATISKGTSETLSVTKTQLPSWSGVTWASSNPTVATVDSNGLVQAKSVGSTTITATSDVSSNLKSTCAVTVDLAKPSSMTMAPTTVNMVVSTTSKVKVTPIPDYADLSVTWVSSDPTVAEVSGSGLECTITSKDKIGTATITATSTSNQSIRANCVITVVADPTIPTNIELNKTSLSLAVGENGTINVASVTPKEAISTVKWSSSKPSIAAIDDTGAITAKAAGNTTITATSTVDPAIKATCEVTVTARPENGGNGGGGNGSGGNGGGGVIVPPETKPEGSTSDKTTWGDKVVNNFVENYVSADGIVSAEVKDDSYVWAKTGNNDEGWFGIDNSAKVLENGARFWVKPLTEGSNSNEWNLYYNALKRDTQLTSDKSKIRIFLVGATDLSNNAYTSFANTLPLYMQLGSNWDKSATKAVYIGASGIEEIDMTAVEGASFPGGTGTFSKLNLKHFSAYAVYETSEETNGSTGGGSSKPGQGGSLQTPGATGDALYYEIGLGIAAAVAIAGAAMVVNAKKRSRKDDMYL